MTPIALALAAAIAVLASGGVELLEFLPAQVILVIGASADIWKKGWIALPRLAEAILAALICIPIVQVLPLPRAILDWLAPGRAALARDLMVTGVALQLAPVLSLTFYDSLLALLRMAAYVLAFVLGYRCIRSGEGRQILFPTLLVLGVVESVLGLVQYLTGWEYLFLSRRPPEAAMASGTYINYNHFAGLLELILPFLLASLYISSDSSSQNPAAPGWKRFLASPHFSIWMIRFVPLIVAFLALLFSGSRSGISCGVLGMVVTASLLLPRQGRMKTFVLTLVIAVVLVGYSTWIGLSPVVERFTSLSMSQVIERDRPVIWRDTLRIMRDFPLFGSGLGSYASVSLHYQTVPTTVRYEHAHNDYLEFAAEIGIPAAIALFGSLWGVAIGVARRATLAERRREKQVASACAGAMIALLLHSLTDFNLQIPANALLFSWIAGTALALQTNARRARLHREI